MFRTPTHTAFLIIAFVFLWNTGFIGAEYGLPYIGPLTLLFWRYLALALLLFLYLALRGRLQHPGWGVLGRTALIGVLAHGVWLACVLIALDQGVPAGIVALVVALQPMTTGALSGWVTGEKTRALQWVGLLLGLLGVVLVVGARVLTDLEVSSFAYFVPFGSVVAITLASLLQERWDAATPNWHLPIDRQLFYQSLATAVLVGGPAFLIEQFQAQWSSELLLSMSWLIVMVSFAAYGLMWLLLERLDATRVASLFYLGPPVTMMMAWVAFGDTVTRMDVAGMALTTVGIVLVQKRRKAP